MNATLTNWSLTVGGASCLPKELRGQRVLFGNVEGRLGVKDGDPIRTNAIVSIEDGYARTASGSLYRLVGPACADFQAWHAAQVDGFRRATEGFEVIGEAAITEVSE